MLPSAAINCLTPAGSGILMFPEQNQVTICLPTPYSASPTVIFYLHCQTIMRLQVGPNMFVNITTPPHDTLSAAVASGFSVQSQCPHGLTIPEDDSKETIVWIPGSLHCQYYHM